MAYCSDCGGENRQSALYCRHCGISLTDAAENIDPPTQSTQKGGGGKYISWKNIRLGVLGWGVLIIFIIGITTCIANENTVEKTVPNQTNKSVATTEVSSRTLTPIATSIPVPTITPSLVPIQIELAKILDEYDQNKVRANTRLRYQENGKIPVSTSGFVSQVEESYVIVTPAQEEYSPQKLYCYYADARAALYVSKGQLVSVTGRVSGTDGYSSRIYMFACEFEGIQLEANPIVLAQKLRTNVVQVSCLSGSIFSTGYKGTGVIIDAEEGIILTVHHVIADENECDAIEVELPGIESRVSATTVKHCASIDRARIRISPQVLAGLSLQPVYRAAAPAQTDQEIYFWGYGPGELRMETGIVKDVQGKNIVADAYAVPGDSGSPVFDENGHLLGTMSRSNRSDRAVFTGDEC